MHIRLVSLVCWKNYWSVWIIKWCLDWKNKKLSKFDTLYFVLLKHLQEFGKTSCYLDFLAKREKKSLL
jgi:hypothetical protein